MAVSPLDHATSPWLAPRSRAHRGGRIRGRLSARWHAWELDHELAAGTSPQASAALAVRAQQITSRRSRRRVADGLARALRSVEPSGAGFTAAARPDAAGVLGARTVLSSLERRLRAPEPVAAHGAAMLALLLTDCTGPLYQPSQPGELGSLLRAAAAALERAGRPAAEPALVASESGGDEARP